MPEPDLHWLALARRAVFECYRGQGARVWVEACGNSMRPAISPGAALLVEFGASPVDHGNIVLFWRGDVLVSHRVVGWRREQDTRMLVVKGDAELYCDPPLHLSNVLGVVRAVRYSRHGPIVSGSCSGRQARASAWISRWTGRVASLVRVGVTVVPGGVRPTVLHAIMRGIRLAAAGFLTPLCSTASRTAQVIYFP